MRSPNKKYKILSLFSGCGGLDLGFAQYGSNTLDLEVIGERQRKPTGNRFEVLWANDIYEPSCKSYAVNFNAELYNDPEEKFQGKHRVFHGDVSTASFSKAVNDVHVDLVLGGFPCQDFSLIRGSDKRLGIKVKRGKLYCHFVRALAHLQPQMFLAENVKGLVSANKRMAYPQILDDFQNLNIRWNEIEIEYEDQLSMNSIDRNQLSGYEMLYSEVTNFANYGVPQKRERLIIIGLRKDLLDNFINLQRLKNKINREIAKSKSVYSKYPLTPIETFNGKPIGELNRKYKPIISNFFKYIDNINSKAKEKYFNEKLNKYTYDIWEDYFRLNNINPHIMGDIKSEINKSHENVLKDLGFFEKELNNEYKLDDESTELLRESKGVIERMKRIPPGENHMFVRNTEYHVTGLMSNIYRRIHPIIPSPTVIARGGGGTWGYHYSIKRQKFTNRERARLQTFPDTFYFEGGSGDVRRQIGEAVPPLAAKSIAKEIVSILDAIEFS